MSNLKVDCYSGYTYAERPRSFVWQEVEYQVAEVEKAWQGPGERHFQVKTTDDRRFRLCYHEAEKEWLLTELD